MSLRKVVNWSVLLVVAVSLKRLLGAMATVCSSPFARMVIRELLTCDAAWLALSSV